MAKNKKTKVELDRSVILATARIYCVVADTVQVPLDTRLVENPATGQQIAQPFRTKDTVTVYQPAGRLIAQAAHVVSRVRDYMVKQYIQAEIQKPGGLQRLKKSDIYLDSYCPEITTIILSARDSFELEHVYRLLQQFELPVHPFFDYNQPDYGDVNRRVMTAIATEPVQPEVTVGILDYLPLWTPRVPKI